MLRAMPAKQSFTAPSGRYRTRFALSPLAKIKVATSFLNWWQQMSTGHLHCYGFEPYATKQKSPSECLGFLRTVLLNRNAEHCKGQENREKFQLLSFFLPFFFVSVHSSFGSPMDTMVVETQRRLRYAR